ncbi:MAG: hypothetical protein R3C59_27100 [Planctomycetaceae bacterium]
MSSDRIRKSTSPKRCWLMLVLLTLTGVGCGEVPEGPLRAAVSGTVSLNGTPLEEGTVVFVPIDGTSGPRVTVSVVDGRFEADPEHGPGVGQHRVEIQSTCGPAFDDEQMVASLEAKPQRLNVVVVPPIYNSNSQLTATIQDQTQNQLTFDLKMPRRR